MDVPTPPLPDHVRRIVYGIWAWGSALILAVIAGWSVIGDLPNSMLAVSVGWQAFGTYAGFLAQNNVGN